MAQLSHGYQVVLIPTELTTGQLALTMVVRRTYRVGLASPVLEALADANQPEPLAADRYDDGDATTVPAVLETDLVPEKARVDVIVLGKAHAPGGKPTAQFDCAVQIGRKRETLRILGPRRAIWQPPRKLNGKMRPQPPRFTAPEPIREVPLSLTLAYGGWSWLVPDEETLRIQKAGVQGMAEDAALAEFPRLPCPTNPFGVGFCVSNHPQVLARLVLPQIEDPRMPLTPQDLIRDGQGLDTVPLPAGFAVLPRHARPRINLAGPLPSDLADWQEKLDAQMQKADLGTPEGVQMLRAMEAREKPQAMRPGFYNCALPAMQMSDLRGDEEVLLENLTPSGRLGFKLPARVLTAEVDRGRGVEQRDLRLDTLVIDTEKAEVSLVWRAQFALASWEELATYPHLVGTVVDGDLEDQRKREEANAAQRARGEGTHILQQKSRPPEMETRAEHDAADLPKLAAHAQAADGGRAAHTMEAALESVTRREQAQAESARRAEISAVVAAGKLVPAKGAKT